MRPTTTIESARRDRSVSTRSIAARNPARRRVAALARSVWLCTPELKPAHPLCNHRRRLHAQMQGISLPERPNLSPRRAVLCQYGFESNMSACTMALSD